MDVIHFTHGATDPLHQLRSIGVPIAALRYTPLRLKIQRPTRSVSARSNNAPSCGQVGRSGSVPRSRGLPTFRACRKSSDNEYELSRLSPEVLRKATG
jgi:hypothetical protein